MCGIVGYWDKTQSKSAELGQTILNMLHALACRGPDSAGVALYGENRNGDLVLRVSLGENGKPREQAEKVVAASAKLGEVKDSSQFSEYLRCILDYAGDPRELEQRIEMSGDGVEVVSMGRNLEIVKQVGSPENLDRTYSVSKIAGTHGIGHTRMSTESAVDLSHSQPFWAHGCPDLAIVHNGHITNYHKMRRQYEQHGVHFYTENDSEIIGIYLSERLSEGKTLDEALEQSIDELGGSFSYLASTRDAVGFARDRFAMKPLLYSETDDFVAVATEEIAIRAAFRGSFEVREAHAKEVKVWHK